MKTQKSERFNFNLVSQSGQPGFELIEDQQNASWRFHGNDVEGKAVLYSQRYSSIESAKKGLSTTVQLLKKNKGKIKKSGATWRLVVQSGNNQELASSSVFKEEQEAKKWLTYFKKVAKAEKRQDVKEANAQTQASAENAPDPIRYAFRIYFYPEEQSQKLTGRIENINAEQEVATFEGLDIATISDFLKKQLETKSLAQEPAEPQGEQAAVAATLYPGVSGSPIIDQNNADPAELILELEDAISTKSKIEQCSLAMRHMDSQKVIHIPNIPAETKALNQISLQLNSRELPIGPYYLNAAVWINTPGQARYCINGTGWAQVI